MTIAAPVDGRVLNLVSQPGGQVGAGSSFGSGGMQGTTVVTMYRPDQLQVRVDVRFEDLPRVSGSQPVLIESPALTVPLHGRVLFLTGFANIQKNTLEVKVSVDEPPAFMKPEMLVDVTFLAPERDLPETAPTDRYRLFVPRSLVDSSGEGHTVWLADPSRMVARRQKIEANSAGSSDMLEVVSGLNASSRVIASERDQLVDGERIRIEGEDLAIIDAVINAADHSEQNPGVH